MHVRFRSRNDLNRAFERGDEQEVVLRIVRSRLPVLAADDRRIHDVRLACVRSGLDRGIERDLAGVPVDLTPRDFVEERHGVDQLTGVAIEDVHIAVAIAMRERGGHHAVDGDVDERRFADGVVVPDVVRRVLVVPLQFAGIGVERERGARIEQRALDAVRVPVRVRVARAPIDGVARDVVGSRKPRRRTAASGAARDFPRVVAGLALGRDRVVLPYELAGVGVVRRDEAARRILAAAFAREDEVLDGKRRARDAVRERIVGDRRVPENLTGLRIERDEVRVERSEDHLAAGERDAAVVDVAARAGVRRDRQRVRVAPDRLAGLRVECEDGRLSGRDVLHAVVDDRRAFHRGWAAERLLPRERQARRIRRADLRERAKTLSAEIATVRQPRVRVLLRVRELIRRDAGGCRHHHTG